MSELTLTVVRVSFVVLLWALVLIIVSVMRADLRPPRVTSRGPGGRAANGAPARKPAKESRKRRGVPKKLVVTEGALAGTTVSLGSAAVTIGRAPDSTLVLDDDYASTRHAQISPQEDGSWIVEDLGSTNGTYLGRTRVTGPTRLGIGAPVRVGKTVVELRK
jgi:pSer/pThr/pTyr-binding forkhead associated (FHA) protein